MAKDQVRQSLIQLLKTPAININKGIIRRTNDSVNGYVSDLVNMEVSNDGEGVERRSGSRCIYNPPENKAWSLYFSEEISGVEIVFLMDYSGRLFCLAPDAFPEYLFQVHKSGFTKIYYTDTEEFEHVVRFDRGTNFFHLTRSDSFSIVNDYGDTITVNKSGAVKFMSTAENSETKFVKSRTENLRLSDSNAAYASVAACYLDLVFHRDIILNSFTLPPAKKETYAHPNIQLPRNASVRGEIRIGQVDAFGRIGKLSGGTFVSKFREFIVSPLNCFDIKSTMSKYIGIYTDIDDPFISVPVTPANKLFAQRDTEAVNAAYESAVFPDVLIDTDEAAVGWRFEREKPNIWGTAFSASKADMNINDTKFRLGIIGEPVLRDSVEYVTALMWADYKSGFTAIPDRQIILDNIGCLMKGFNLKIGTKPIMNTGVVLESLIAPNLYVDTSAGSVEGQFLEKGDTNGTLIVEQGVFDSKPPVRPEIALYIRKTSNASILPWKYVDNGYIDTLADEEVRNHIYVDSVVEGGGEQINPNDYRAIIYQVVLAISPTEMPASWDFFYLYDDTTQLASNSDYIDDLLTRGFTSMGEITLRVGFNKNTNKPVGFVPAYFHYDFYEGQDFALLKNLGYNNWEVSRNYNIPDKIINNPEDYAVSLFGEIRLDSYDIYTSSDPYLKYDVAIPQLEFDKFFKEGSRFCVWNDNVVLAVSQKCFSTETSLKPVYTKLDNDTNKFYTPTDQGRVVNHQETVPFSVSGYLPVCSLEYITMASFNYSLRPLVKTISGAKDIVINRNIVYMLDKGSVWIGSDSDLNMFPLKADVSKSVNLIAPMDTGAVSFGFESMDYIFENGSSVPVRGLNNLKTATAVKAKYMPDGRVYGVNEAGEIFRVSIQYTENNSKYYLAENLSNPLIPQVIWGKDTDITYADNTVWFSRETEIWGFSKNGWLRKYTTGSNKIRGIFAHGNNLCVIFNNAFILVGRVRTFDLPFGS